MAQQSFSGLLYLPSDVLADDDSDFGEKIQKKNLDYEQEVSNMLATILETKRQMQATGQQILGSTQIDIQQFLQYQEKFPYLVKKLQKKFKKFNLTTSQLLKFIKIQQKFLNFSNQISTSEAIVDLKKQSEPQKQKKSRKNLVQVHGILLRKKSFKLNPRIYQ